MCRFDKRLGVRRGFVDLAEVQCYLLACKLDLKGESQSTRVDNFSRASLAICSRKVWLMGKKLFTLADCQDWGNREFTTYLVKCLGCPTHCSP